MSVSENDISGMDGTIDGTTDGDIDGTTDGTIDGTTDGDIDGTTDGTIDGASPGTVTNIRATLENFITDQTTPTTDARARFGSQDDLDSPHLDALKEALSAFNARALDDMAKKTMWTADTIIDTRKFRNPLHFLIECYINSSESGTVVNLFQSLQECLSVCFEHGLDINEGDISRNSPLHLLCHHCGVDDVIKMLLASGAKVNLENANQQTPLHLATDNGSPKDVEVLLEGGADPNKLDCTGMGSLHNAVKYRRNRETIKFLVGCGAVVDLQARDGQRIMGPAPLHLAVRSDRRENVKLLLELGAWADVTDTSEQTPLHLAAKYDITGEIVSMLLRGDAYPDQRDAINGETPLHKAIRSNMADNIRVLVKGGASLSVADNHGDSALHVAAACCRDIGTWVTLMNATRADIRLRNAKGQTVLERAARGSNKLAVNILKQVEG